MTTSASISDGARRHLALWTADLHARLLRTLDDALGRGIFHRDDVERRFPFLEEVDDDLKALAGRRHAERVPDTFTRLAVGLEQELGYPPPLARVQDAFDDRGAADILVAAALVERDARFGAVYSFLQAPGNAVRPCIGLLAHLYEREVDEVANLAQRLASSGFIVIEQPDELLPERSIRIPPTILAAIDGTPDSTLDITRAEATDGFEHLVLPEAVAARVERAASLAQGGQLDALVLRGADGTGRRTALRAIAAHGDLGLLVTEPSHEHAVALSVLTGSMLAWTVDPGLGQLTDVTKSPLVPTLGVIAGTRGAVRVAKARHVAVIDLPKPGPDARRRFWQRAPVGPGAETLDKVSARYLLSGGTIETVAARAEALALLDGRSSLEIGDIRQAAQDQGRPRLEALAALLPPVPSELQPVLSGETESSFEALVLRCRKRELIGPAIGGPIASQITTGVRALMSGPSGTGKTLSARSLGARLDLDVYRADLAALVDKYIGETERRLDELFTRAEDLDVILLIDEGDALMTQRTDVRSSNDRYANLETDYLLQRLEAFTGIVLITTNAPQLVDQAFRRRLDVTIRFGPPGPAQRAAILAQHLPQQHLVGDDQLEHIANSCRLTGGQIRNAVIHATLLALDRNEEMNAADLRAAMVREFELAGLSSPFSTADGRPSPFEVAAGTR